VIEEPVSGRRTSVKRFTDFQSLAGSVPVPGELEGASWSEVRRQAREQRARRKGVLDLYTAGLDFADAYLVAAGEDAGIHQVLSFDRFDAKLERSTKVRRVEP
jgi:predicted nucleic acid-binding protein